jgi:hypothetical protein
MAPTAGIVAAMAAHAAEFQARGGVVFQPPYPAGVRARWRAQARSYREAWDFLPTAERTDRLRSGLSFLVAALTIPRCFVALFRGELVAALSYQVALNRIEVKAFGSRQLPDAGGAGTALEAALAKEAVRRQLRVHSTYTADARNFHVRIGRRLDRIPGENSSEWELEDCEVIVGGVYKGGPE